MARHHFEPAESTAILPTMCALMLAADEGAMTSRHVPLRRTSVEPLADGALQSPSFAEFARNVPLSKIAQ